MPLTLQSVPLTTCPSLRLIIVKLCIILIIITINIIIYIYMCPRKIFTGMLKTGLTHAALPEAAPKPPNICYNIPLVVPAALSKLLKREGRAGAEGATLPYVGHLQLISTLKIGADCCQLCQYKLT